VKLIVGLGNPGAEYARTRHNAGFMVVDRLADRHASGSSARQKFHALSVEAPVAGVGKVLLMKPMTYMNRSGLAVGEAVRFFKLDPAEDLLVVVDEVALPAGSLRLRGSGSAGGHNGLADIERALGTRGYARLRVGVDAPGGVPQADYVLGRFSPEQWDRVEPALERAGDCAEAWLSEGVVSAMNKFNQRGVGDGPADDATDGGRGADAGAATEDR
jgi:PTH1 family peptidyl-tRNA hydrolase